MKKILKWVVIAFVGLIVIGMALGGKDETPQKVEKEPETQAASTEQNAENKESEQKEQPKEEVYNIGDSIKIGDVVLTVNSVKEDSGSEYIKPSDGNVYYIIDMTIENKGEKAYNSSTLMQMSLVDSDGYKYDITIGPKLKGSLDGEIGAGRKLRGEVAFEIPKDATGLEFVYDYKLLSNGQIIVKLDR